MGSRNNTEASRWCLGGEQEEILEQKIEEQKKQEEDMKEQEQEEIYV